MENIKLTKRELEIAIRILKEGLTDKELAHRFNVSLNTIKTQVKTILKLANCRTRLQFAIKFYTKQIDINLKEIE